MMKLVLIAPFILFGALSTAHARATDSTANLPGPYALAPQTYLLAHGTITTQVGNYDVKVQATTERCFKSTTPMLSTSLTGIEFYGWSQAIGGVVNSLTFNPETYEIEGQLSAPVNIEGRRPNGAQVNWEIWCKAETTA